MTGASYLVAVTSSFQSVPDIVAPPRDESKHNNDRGLHEEKPWNIKPEKKSLSWGVEVKEAADDKVLEAVGEESGKKEAAQQEMKQANERLENETKTAAETDEKETQKPEQNDVKGDEQQKPEDSQKKKKPLNILLLYGDDWRHDSIGAASGGLVKTPFLDNLGTQGVRFTHNCVTTSVCWVSRATLYTGQYVSRHKSTEPMKPEFYKGWNQTFPYLLREAGYYFGHVGKWHFKDYEEFVKPQLDWERFYYGSHWYPTRDGEIHSTKLNEKDAIEFLRERPKDKPFCLTVCFFTPHAEDGNPKQYLVQNESLALYVNDTIPVAMSATEEAWKKLPNFFVDINEGRNRFFWRFDTPEKYQTMMKNYYRLISEIDSTSGKIVKELEDQGIIDETLVIFTTDNGYFHAEHGLADKWYPYQESIRVPMIIRDPRMAKDKIGTLNDDFTLSIDLAPTILGAAGLPTPNVMHGRDFAPLYTEEKLNEPWRREFFYEHPVHLREDIIPASEALVRKDFKYMFWPNYNVEQLFDLKNDTYELNDLINSTSHKELLQEMRKRFKKLKVRAQ